MDSDENGKKPAGVYMVFSRNPYYSFIIFSVGSGVFWLFV